MKGQTISNQITLVIPRWNPSSFFIQAKPSQAKPSLQPLIFFPSRSQAEHQRISSEAPGERPSERVEIMPGKVRWQGLNDPRRAGELYAERWHTGEPVCFGHLDEPDTSKLSAYRYQLRVLVFNNQFTPFQGNKQTNRLSSHYTHLLLSHLYFPQQIFSLHNIPICQNKQPFNAHL